MAGMRVHSHGADTAFTRTDFPAGTCPCWRRLPRHLLDHLGVADSDLAAAPGETLVERLRALGREAEYADHFRVYQTAADSLVVRAIESGFLDQEADRLERLGRIVVEPVAAASALGVQPGDPVGPTPSTHGRARADGADSEETLGSRIVGRAKPQLALHPPRERPTASRRH